MPQASKSTASEHIALEGYEGHFNDFGPYTVGFETRQTQTSRRCSWDFPTTAASAHTWGMWSKGKVKFTFADGTEEVYEAGDAYYAPPGHLPTLHAGSEVVEFSPTAELQQTMAVVEKNMEAAGGA